MTQTLELKQRVEKIAKPEYWTCLTDFLQGRLSKFEFDFYLKDYMPDITLHNEFILKRLEEAESSQNISSKNVNSIQLEQMVKSKKFDTGTVRIEAKDVQHIKNIHSTRVAQKNPLIDLPLLLHNSKFPNKISTEQLSTLINQNSHLTSLLIPSTITLCYDSKTLPSRKDLRLRLQRVSLEFGLIEEIEDDVLDVMNSALCMHLKNIASSILKSIPNKPKQITKKEFIFAAKLNPSLFVDNSLCIEKWNY